MKNWKEFEKDVARFLGGRRIVNARFSRPNRVWFRSAPDVEVPRHPELKIDCKRYAQWTHHRQMRAIQAKYCTHHGDEPVLITRENGRPESVVSIRLEFFARLSQAERRQRKFFGIFPGPRDGLPKGQQPNARLFPLTLEKRLSVPKESPLSSLAGEKSDDTTPSRTATRRLPPTTSGGLRRSKMKERVALRWHNLAGFTHAATTPK